MMRVLWRPVVWALLAAGLVILCGARPVRAAETGESDIANQIYESIPMDDMEKLLQELKEEDIDFSVKEYVKQVMEGDGELSLSGIGKYLAEYVEKQLSGGRNTFVKLVLYAVISGIFLNFSFGMYEKQMGETGFYILYFLAAAVMVGGFGTAFEVASGVLTHIVDFMRALAPSFSLALVWSSGEATSMAFYQTALFAVGIADELLVRIFLPVVQVHFLISLLNPISGWRFSRFTALIRGFVNVGTKTILAVMIGQQGIRGLIMPALDGVKRSTFFKAADSIPGVGNLFGGVTDTVIGTGILIKSAIGVGGLVAIAVICILPLLRIGVFTVLYRGLAAFAQPVADKRIVSVFQSTSESGRLLFDLIFMTAVMFLVTLTIMIAATNSPVL